MQECEGEHACPLTYQLDSKSEYVGLPHNRLTYLQNREHQPLTSLLLLALHKQGLDECIYHSPPWASKAKDKETDYPVT